jgi:hypothetical protein
MTVGEFSLRAGRIPGYVNITARAAILISKAWPLIEKRNSSHFIKNSKAAADEQKTIMSLCFTNLFNSLF